MLLFLQTEVMVKAKPIHTQVAQQNTYSISHLLGTVNTLDSGWEVTVHSCWQHGDLYTAI